MSVPAPFAAASHPAIAAALALVLADSNPNTERAYRQGWRHFTGWCAAQALPPLPAAPETVAAFLVAHAVTHSRATLEQRLAAIGAAHDLSDHPFVRSHPLIRRALAAIGRSHGRPQIKAAALLPSDLAAMTAAADGLAALRDRALILLGFAGAFRRAELAAVRIEHMDIAPTEIRVMIPRAKTDQQGRGVTLTIPAGANAATCPVLAVRAWIESAGIADGPLFRRVMPDGRIGSDAIVPETVRDVVKRLASRAGVVAPAGERMAAHGLRSGFVTACVLAGVPENEAMPHTRHVSVQTYRGYERVARLAHASPAGRVGL